LIRLAKKYPANTKMQNYKMKMLKKNKMIDKEDLSESNMGYSSGESYEPKKDIYNKKESDSTKQLQMVARGLNQCQNLETGIFNPRKVFEFMNEI